MREGNPGGGPKFEEFILLEEALFVKGVELGFSGGGGGGPWPSP